MKLLMFGRTGQLAREVLRAAPAAGVTVTALGRDAADLRAAAACAALVAATDADAVLNAAAYTAVDRAETEPDLAHAVNAEAPAAMARAAAAAGKPFVHLSTDYVFDGSGARPWRPEDATAPLNVYGASKRAGEEGVAAAGGRQVILRTSWVFSAHGANFVKTMLRLSESRDRLRIVADQVGGPTAAADIAAACLAIVRGLLGGRPGGIQHFAGAPEVSWAGFAREIFAQAGRAVTVEEIATSDFPTPAARPMNSRLDCSALSRDFGLARPDWRASLAQVLAEIGEAGQ